MPEMWRQGAARNRHDGHVRRLVVVLLSILRSDEHRTAVRSSESEILDAGGFLCRWRGACNSAFDLLAVLRPRVPRSGDGRGKGAVQAPADAGHGLEGRRRHVQVK